MTRKGRVRQIYETYPPQDPGACPLAELLESDGRYLLVESGKYGGHYLSRHESPGSASAYIHHQEYPEDWSAVTLIDLATGVELSPDTVTTFR